MIDKQAITEIIAASAAERQRGAARPTWRAPLVGVAAADDPLFARLREVVRPTHALPAELLPGARSVVVFFLPFEPHVGASNRAGGMSSAAWARAYLETNALIDAICRRVAALFAAHGERVRATPATHNFDPAELVSDWSHRHVAHVAGLGTLGQNNMLITDRGCCGRLGSLITSAALAPDPRPERERCLRKRGDPCDLCVGRCVNAALHADGFDRHRCREVLQDNARHHAALGDADVCGKCVVKLPCSHVTPRGRSARRAPR